MRTTGRVKTLFSAGFLALVAVATSARADEPQRFSLRWGYVSATIDCKQKENKSQAFVSMLFPFCAQDEGVTARSIVEGGMFNFMESVQRHCDKNARLDQLNFSYGPLLKDEGTIEEARLSRSVRITHGAIEFAYAYNAYSKKCR